jgi:prepilin-type N-terminal cleavage/methylation domain-containing protein
LPRSRRRTAGFTLVETITALAIFALLSGLLASSLFAARQNEKAVNDRSTGTLRTLRLNTIFAATLEAVTTAGLVRGERTAPIFTADARTLEFLAALDGQTERSGIFAVKMSIESLDGPDGPMQRLRFERRRLNKEGAPIGRTEAAILHETRNTLAFTFQDERQEGSAGTGPVKVHKLVERWPDSSRLPRRIMLMEGRRIIAQASPAVEIDGRCIVLRGMDRFDSSDCFLR